MVTQNTSAKQAFQKKKFKAKRYKATLFLGPPQTDVLGEGYSSYVRHNIAYYIDVG